LYRSWPLAIDTPYGLEAALKIEEGMIGVNQGLASVSGTPWVGVKQSGYGYIGSIDGNCHSRESGNPVKN